MDKKRIEEKMDEFQSIIQYRFSSVVLLEQAMSAIRIKPQNRSKKCLEYTNSGLATVGDALLSAVLSDYYFSKGISAKGDITDNKSVLENNETLHSIVMSEGWINYAYNGNGFYGDQDLKEHLKVQATKHDSYVEAIIGAIYYDSNFDIMKKWVIDFLLPLLEKYKNVKTL